MTTTGYDDAAAQVVRARRAYAAAYADAAYKDHDTSVEQKYDAWMEEEDKFLIARDDYRAALAARA